MTIEDYSVWTPAEYPPSKPGHYLVAQRKENKRYHWIRFWTSEEWSNAKLDAYGEVYAWAELPPFP